MTTASTTSSSMRAVSSKIARGTRLSETDALWLYEHAPLAELGSLANSVNLQKNGRAVFFNVNRHINPTNICSLSCKFCAYSKKIGEPGSYAYEIPEMIAKAGEAISQGATELHMVGGLHPRWGFERYVEMIAALRKTYPEVHLKAFTAVELDWMARKARKSIAEVITELRDAGLNSFPGGGAEIFHPEVRDIICDTKVSGEQWINTHRTAHQMGMRSNCTMLYGHIERYEHRVDHMRYLRDLQDETHGFNVFIPLAFQPFQNEMGVNRYTFGADDLRTIAVARLYLDYFRHIKSYWVMLGQDIAQLALHFGANDLDGTVLEEKISRAAGGRSGMIMTKSNLEDLIRRSGRIPVERTTLYDPIHASDRIHMQPVIDESSVIASELIRRIQNESFLSVHETWQLVTSASLTQLSDAVTADKKKASYPTELIVREAISVDGSVALASGSISSFTRNLVDQHFSNSIAAENCVDICLDVSRIDPSCLKNVVLSVHDAVPQNGIILRGLKNLAAASTADGMRLTEWLGSLRLFNVKGVADTGSESDDLDVSHRVQLLSSAAAADLRAAIYLNLSAVHQAPDWAAFCEELVTLRGALHSIGVQVEVNLGIAEGSERLMPSEFMAALALTRLTLGPETLIYTEPTRIPSLAPQQGLGADNSHHPVMKLLSVVSAYGSNGLGSVSLDAMSVQRLMEDLLASGENSQLVDFAHQNLEIRSDRKLQFKQLRHVPAVQELG